MPATPKKIILNKAKQNNWWNRRIYTKQMFQLGCVHISSYYWWGKFWNDSSRSHKNLAFVQGGVRSHIVFYAPPKAGKISGPQIFEEKLFKFAEEFKQNSCSNTWRVLMVEEIISVLCSESIIWNTALWCHWIEGQIDVSDQPIVCTRAD